MQTDLRRDTRDDRSSENISALRGLTHLLDEAITIPGTGIKVGLDALLGLIPGLGDLAGGVMGGYAILVASRLGAPPSVLAHMLLNIGIDSLVGVLPVLGDLFDIGWKANTKNLKLLERYVAAPASTKKGSVGVLAVVLLALVAMIVGGVWLAFTVVRALLGLVT